MSYLDYIYSDDLWGSCRVIESIVCIELGSRGLYYCSPMGIFRSSRFRITIRAYHDSNIINFLELSNKIQLFICRDPKPYYILLNNHVVDRFMLKDITRACGFNGEFNISGSSYTDLYREFIITPVHIFHVGVPHPAYLGRICRSENSLIEALVLYTRRNLYVGSSSYISYRDLLNYHIDVFKRLSQYIDYNKLGFLLETVI